MSGTRYVQHISGEGEKWEVHTQYPFYWLVYSKLDHPAVFSFSNSEYVECAPGGAMSYQTIDWKLNAILELLKPKEPPVPVEEYRDVTKTFQEHHLTFAPCISREDGYRLRKIDGMHNGPAFIIERKRS